MASKLIGIAPVTAFAAAVALSATRSHSVAIMPLTSFAASPKLSGGSARVAFSPLTSFSALPVLTGRSAKLQFAPETTFYGTGELTGRSGRVSFSPLTSFEASASIVGGNSKFALAPTTSFEGTARLSGSSARIQAQPLTSFSASPDLAIDRGTLGMNLCDIVADALGMWGMFCRDTAPSFAISRAFADLNQSLQVVWNNAEGRDYWTNVPITITLADGENSQDLGDDIQNVVGPCRRADNFRPLICLGSTGEFETFSDYYLGGETASEPLAYYIERTAQTEDDPAKCILKVTPSVQGEEIDLILDVVKEPPHFVPGDLVSCPLMPIPHKYIESLLLPIIRYHASTFYLFRKTDQKPTIDREYQKAMISLGLADPLPGNAGDNMNKREESK